MKKLSLITAVLIAASFMLVGCSNNDRNEDWQRDGSFAVTQSIPGNGSVGVNQSDPITIYFTKDLVYGQVSPTCYSIQRLDTSTQTLETITTVAAPTAQGNMLIFNPPMPLGKWSMNSTYYINLSSCIKSILGDLLVPAQITFSTGTGIGQISVTGKPRITYMELENFTGCSRDCLAVHIEFNETLANGEYLYTSVTISALFDWWTVGSFPLYPMNYYPNYPDGRNFWLIFPYDSNGYTFGCDPIYYQFGQKLTIKVSGAIDLDNEVMNPFSKEFDYIADYACISYSGYCPAAY